MAQAYLLGGDVSSVLDYPPECFVLHSQTCPSSTEIACDTPVVLPLTTAGTYWFRGEGTIPTFALVSALSWNHTNWAVRVHGGTSCAFQAQSGVLTPANTSVLVFGWPGGKAWLQLATTNPTPELEVQITLT